MFVKEILKISLAYLTLSILTLNVSVNAMKKI